MKQRIIIAGFGDTGLLTAIHLPKCFEIIGISPKPCLVSGQELGTRLSRPEQWRQNYLMPFDRFEQLAGVQTLHGLVKSIDPAGNTLTMRGFDGEEQLLNYDALLISTGVSNGFWRNNALESEAEINELLLAMHGRISAANSLSIVGGGASAVSAAANIKEQFPDKRVNLIYSRERPLPEYHPRTGRTVERMLCEQGVQLYPKRRAILPAVPECFSSGAIRFEHSAEELQSDLTLWAVGRLRPNNQGLPAAFLNEQGFVKVDPCLRVPGFENVFAVGDIAATDVHRCSARNKGFEIVAGNITRYLRGDKSMRSFRPARFRWGSIMGVRNEGMRVFTPKGRNIRISRWAVDKLLFPLAVRKMIYKGVRKAGATE